MDSHEKDNCESLSFVYVPEFIAVSPASSMVHCTVSGYAPKTIFFQSESNNQTIISLIFNNVKSSDTRNI
jgi:hypothetical protein